MYRVYELTEKERGKIWRRRFDGDTTYFDVYDSPEELEEDSERLRKIKEDAEKEFENYLESLKKDGDTYTTPATTFEGSPEQYKSFL